MKKRKKDVYSRVSQCHVGPIEVIKNLFCGGEKEAFEMAAVPIHADTLIPLNSMGASIWDSGFRGEILYYPIQDYGVLPNDVLEELVSKILDRLDNNKKVGLFCMGGHGRTGYVASIVLGKLGYEDPIQFLRSNYCRGAVESGAQIRHIAEVLGKAELVQKHEVQSLFEGLDKSWADFYSKYGFEDNCLQARSVETLCGNCACFIAGKCQKYNVFVNEDDLACCDFTERKMKTK